MLNWTPCLVLLLTCVAYAVNVKYCNPPSWYFYYHSQVYDAFTPNHQYAVRAFEGGYAQVYEGDEAVLTFYNVTKHQSEVSKFTIHSKAHNSSYTIMFSWKTSKPLNCTKYRFSAGQRCHMRNITGHTEMGGVSWPTSLIYVPKKNQHRFLMFGTTPDKKYHYVVLRRQISDHPGTYYVASYTQNGPAEQSLFGTVDRLVKEACGSPVVLDMQLDEEDPHQT
eukprot:TRINITY_DN16593_c0_g1_i1.p1 TRINITY_DN16593_c0_g1~~TRINITY_DN16593_c0_g1_i1.p1  ORF type:complete len:222 (-),score=18.15 TRINITY_DN16593_c0_g1_i1:82-747(-)